MLGDIYSQAIQIYGLGEHIIRNRGQQVVGQIAEIKGVG